MRYSIANGRRLGALLALATGALAACNTDDVLAVNDPDVVRPSALTDTSTLAAFLAGAQTDFQNGFNGNNTEGQVNMVGLFTDEFIQTESFPTRFEVDTRAVTRENTTMGPIFLDLSRARASAERASRLYTAAGRETSTQRMDALNLAGFSYVLFAENYCSGVPFSTLDEQTGALTFGDAQTTAQMLRQAQAKFDTVLANTASTAAQRNLARVGRGRAYLDLNLPDSAAAAVNGVLSNFVFAIQHSDNSARQNNGVWNLTTNQGRWGVANLEGGTGLTFATDSLDYRVLNRRRRANSGNGFDGGPMREQLKDSLRTIPKTLADGVEARLIEAEAQLRAGNNAGFITTLNTLRSDATVRSARGYAAVGSASDRISTPLVDPGTATGRQDLLFKERAYWLFLTSHRLGDLRRLMRQYGRTEATTFPSGGASRNYTSNGRLGVYGADVNFPIPIGEANNTAAPTVGQASPNALKGCIDRNP